MPQNRAVVPLTLVLILLAAGAPPPRAELPTHDETGGYTLTVSFDYGSLVQSGLLDVDAFTEERYCSLFSKVSHHLWQATEGQHWVRRVEFHLGLQDTHINWDFVAESETNYGNFKNAIIWHEAYNRDFSPLENPPPTPDEVATFYDDRIAWGIVHEMGHYNYGVSDEYLHARTSGGTLGFCSGFTGGTCIADSSILCVGDSVCAAANPGDTCGPIGSRQSCEDDSHCTMNETCITAVKVCSDYVEGDDPPTANDFTECDTDADCAVNDTCSKKVFRCTGVGANVTMYCNEDEDCQQGNDTGWCVREGESGQPRTRYICRNKEAPFPGDNVDPNDCPYLAPNEEKCYRKRISGMSAGGGGGRWCDAETHRTSRQILRGFVGRFNEDGSGGDPLYLLRLEEKFGLIPKTYSTWGRAARTDIQCKDDPNQECEKDPEIVHPDLRSYLKMRPGYPQWADLDVTDFKNAVNFDNTFECVWNIDDVPLPGDNTVLLVDKSGSMDYVIGITGRTAFEWAARGALAVMEGTDLANWIGMTAFADDQVEVQEFVERGSLEPFPADPFQTYFEDDGIVAAGATDIGTAIEVATAQIQADPMSPEGGRNIILMSDLNNTVFNGIDPLEAAAAACNAGIKINTVPWGEDVDTSLLKDIADVCGGESVAGATEKVLVEGTDPHLLKTEFFRMKYKAGGLREISHDLLGQLSDNEDVQSFVFYVPADAASLVFTWVGHEVPWCAEFDQGEICIDERDVWTELAFSVKDPNMVATPGTIGNSYQATAVVVQPEPGFWTAQVDASAVPVVQNQVIREATRVSWLAHIDHPDLLARAWVDEWKRGLDDPVLVNAQLFYRRRYRSRPT
jgi:hypothetical protein